MVQRGNQLRDVVNGKTGQFFASPPTKRLTMVDLVTRFGRVECGTVNVPLVLGLAPSSAALGT